VLKHNLGFLLSFKSSETMKHNTCSISNKMSLSFLTETNDAFNHFNDQVKGEIEARSQRGSVWVIEGILNAFVNVTRHEPFHGGSYFPLPKKLQNKKAIINIQNKDNQCLRWALRAALFPATKGKNPIRPGSYPTTDGFNFTAIDFPTPISQINKLENQNANLAINVFG